LCIEKVLNRETNVDEYKETEVLDQTPIILPIILLH